jgi:hypothetical protein
VAKLSDGHVAGVVTVRANVFVALVPPPLKVVSVTVYVPAGCAFVTRTTPVIGLTSSVPLKLVEEETLMLVAFPGAASGVIVASALSTTDESG